MPSMTKKYSNWENGDGGAGDASSGKPSDESGDNNKQVSNHIKMISSSYYLLSNFTSFCCKMIYGTLVRPVQIHRLLVLCTVFLCLDCIKRHRATLTWTT